MSQPENSFIQSVHRYLPNTLYRMKNHNEYNSGIADVWYSAVRDLWVEYKFLKVPVRDSTSINLVAKKKNDWGITPLQRDWLNSRHDEGRNVWVVVGSKDGGVIFRNKAWEHPVTAEVFRLRTIPRSKVAEYLVSFLTGASP